MFSGRKHKSASNAPVELKVQPPWQPLQGALARWTNESSSYFADWVARPRLQAHRCRIGRKTNLGLSFVPRIDASKLPLGLHLSAKFVLLAL